MAKRRKAGEGSVHLRKDGRWEGRYVIGYDENGLPKTKNVLAKTKSACVEKLKKLKAELGGIKSDKLKPDMSFGEWLEYWYQNICKPTVRPKTQVSHEERIYLHIIPALGTVPLNRLTQDDLQQFYARLKQSGRLTRTEEYGAGLSDRTVRGCHTTCRLALQKAVEDGLIKNDPAAHCKLPPSARKEMQVLTPDEIRRLLIQAKEDGYFELLLLELTTGLRRGEICGLKWDDLDFKTRTLVIQRQVQRIRGELVISRLKTKASNRIVVLPEPVARVLMELRLRTPSRWMFPSPKKEDAPLDPAAVRKRVSIILERAQCNKVRFHDLRHTFATSALENGMDVKTLSAIIGHVSAATTLNIYAHVTDEMQQAAALKIDKGIGNAKPKGIKRKASQKKLPAAPFQPYQGKHRKAGTGCVSQINDHLWEGRYTPTWPDGRRRSRNVYAKTEEECERLLAQLIVEMKAEIAAEKAKQNRTAS